MDGNTHTHIRKHMGNYEFDGEFAQKVLDFFYVDDFSSGENTLERAFELFKKLKIRFSERLFYLRKWRTNDPKLRNLISENNESESKPSKILGRIWNETNDFIVFNFKEICDFSKTLKATKRNVLKVLAMFYDPIGFLQPIIINLKIIFQKLCELKLSWDENIPEDLNGEWLEVLHFLEEVREIELPRKMLLQDPLDPLELVELHCFSDASFQNYGACIYVRSVSQSGKTSVSLVAAESRLAPIKPPTIPRLEILGNLLLSRLMVSVENSLYKLLQISNKYFWADSQVTPAWISSQMKEFKIFVKNKVQEIRRNSNLSDWQYSIAKLSITSLIF